MTEGYVRGDVIPDSLTAEERLKFDQNRLHRAQVALGISELRLLAMEVETDARLLRISDRPELWRLGLLYSERGAARAGVIPLLDLFTGRMTERTSPN